MQEVEKTTTDGCINDTNRVYNGPGSAQKSVVSSRPIQNQVIINVLYYYQSFSYVVSIMNC